MRQNVPNIRVKGVKAEWLGSSDGLMRLLDQYDKLHKKDGMSGEGSSQGSVAILRSMVKMIQLRSDAAEPWIKWVKDNLGSSVQPASAHAFVELFKKMDVQSIYESRILPLVIIKPLVQLKSILETEKVLDSRQETA